jgi:2-keto-3-deoxy-L-rhamnonate aldolase RhmA
VSSKRDLPARNRLRGGFANGGVILGTIIGSSRNPETVQMAAAAGYDFVWMDMQHSASTLAVVADMCLAARAYGITPIVRPDVLNFETVRRLLDVGAMGIVFFDVKTPEQILRYSEWLRQPAESPSSREFLDGDREMLDRYSVENLAFITQIESRAAVDGIDELLDAATPDLIQIGRMDLSADLGFPHQVRHPEVLEAIDRITAAASRRNVPVAAGAYGKADVEYLYERGVRCFHYGTDFALLMTAYREGIRMLNEVTTSTRS